MKKLTALFLIVCTCLSISACGGDRQSGNNSGGGGQATQLNVKEISPGVVVVNDCKIEIKDFEVEMSIGGTFGFVYINLTNNGNTQQSLNSTVKIRVYQNGVECREASMYEFSVTSPSRFETNDYDNVLPGYTAKTGKLFKLKSYTELVLVQIIYGEKVISEVTFDPNVG